MAHGLVMQVKLDHPEEATKMLKEIVVPMAKSQTGFLNGTWMHDKDNNGMGVLLFDTAENAEAAKDVLKPPPDGPQLISISVYEVAAQA